MNTIKNAKQVQEKEKENQKREGKRVERVRKAVKESAGTI